MAIYDSTAQFVAETGAGKLQVEDRFNSLVTAVTGPNSIYIKAKESMLEYFIADDGNASLSDREKAELLSKMISDMAVSMTAQLMADAIKIEVEDRDAPYALAKVVADVKQTTEVTDKMRDDRYLVAKQRDKLDSDIEQARITGLVNEATAFSRTGITIPASGPLVPTVRDDKATEYQTALKAISDIKIANGASYRKDGPMTITYNIDGTISGLNPEVNNPYVGLSEAQTGVAIRNEEAFDDNMLQHAVNSSANLMGLMISADNANLLAGTPTGAIPEKYLSALSALSVNTAPTASSITETTVVDDTAAGTRTTTTTVTTPGVDTVLGTADDDITVTTVITPIPV